jgi:hypothetical protein
MQTLTSAKSPIWRWPNWFAKLDSVLPTRHTPPAARVIEVWTVLRGFPCRLPIRRSLSTTNVVEAINGQLEIMRPNSGGYFHPQDTLKLNSA